VVENEDAADPAVVARDLTKRFADHEVIRGISFEVRRGEIMGIVGASGGGKTTVLRMLLGLLPPSSGELRVLGRQPHEFSSRDRDRIGYSPQLFASSPDLSVAENMRFAASLYAMRWSRQAQRIRTALELVDLWEARSRVGSELSGGMQKRLQLAATLVHEPELIFLDEPTAGIDPVLRATFWDHFRHLRDEGRTLIVTTQYVTESEYCDDILALRDGRIVASGPPAAVRKRVMGGEVVRVEGPSLDGRALATVEAVAGVRQVRRLDGETLEVVVEDAGQAMPALLSGLQAAGITVRDVREEHPSFDEVFVRLMRGADGASGVEG
jgi:ABC-2 type transport system ATP-binding protein